MTADELVTLYLLIRSVFEMSREYKYRDHPFCQRLNDLLFSAHRFQGLAAKDIADDMGITQSAMSFYKTGHCLPGTENLLKLADYFGVSTDYLLGREGYEIGG